MNTRSELIERIRELDEEVEQYIGDLKHARDGWDAAEARAEAAYARGRADGIEEAAMFCGERLDVRGNVLAAALHIRAGKKDE